MYISSDSANIIKSYAKIKGFAIKDILEACGLNKNTLSTMTSRGSWIQADSLAKIADYLDCSVDYLLGRTNVPEVNRNIKTVNTTEQFEKASNINAAAYGEGESTI